MSVGVETSRLMVRFDPALTDEIMEKEGCRPMDFTSKVMKGFAFVDIEVLNTKKNLEFWIKLALDYNKVAKASKKKEKIIISLPNFSIKKFKVIKNKTAQHYAKAMLC